MLARSFPGGKEWPWPATWGAGGRVSRGASENLTAGYSGKRAAGQWRQPGSLPAGIRAHALVWPGALRAWSDRAASIGLPVAAEAAPGPACNRALVGRRGFSPDRQPDTRHVTGPGGAVTADDSCSCWRSGDAGLETRATAPVGCRRCAARRPVRSGRSARAFALQIGQAGGMHEAGEVSRAELLAEHLRVAQPLGEAGDRGGELQPRRRRRGDRSAQCSSRWLSGCDGSL